MFICVYLSPHYQIHFYSIISVVIICVVSALLSNRSNKDVNTFVLFIDNAHCLNCLP